MGLHEYMRRKQQKVLHSDLKLEGLANRCVEFSVLGGRDVTY